MIKEGIYTDLSSEDYHGDKASLSRSSIKDYARNPYYYYSMHLNASRPPREPTKDMLFGSAFHTFILEPHLFELQYDIEPPKVLLKDVGRAKFDEYKLKCEQLLTSTKIILSYEELMQLNDMKTSLFRDQRIVDMLIDAKIEHSFFWKDKDSGLMLKARPDAFQENMIIDLKTIADASAHAYQRDMVSGWYHVQGAMIRDAFRNLPLYEKDPVIINICVEKKYPYCVGIYIIDEAAIDYGEQKYKSILLKMKESLGANSFSDYDVETIGLPKWAI